MTIFSKIAAGEIPSYKCAENEQFYAFLDIDPVTKGHTLVIPRKRLTTSLIWKMRNLQPLRFCKEGCTCNKDSLPCKKVAQVVLGLRG